MSDEQKSADVLARAHRAWSPTTADADRVRRAVATAVCASATANRPPPQAIAAPWAARLLVASALAAASGGVGYWTGHRAGLRDAHMATPAPPASPASPATAAVEPKQPIAPPPPPAPSLVAVPSPVLPHHDLRPAHHGTGTETRSTTESLATEVQGLRNAERALRDGNPGLALAFLAELDRQVPRGQLTEERDAADALAHCARSDRPFGIDPAEEFTQRHPASVYRARVEQACRTTDSSVSGDSSP